MILMIVNDLLQTLFITAIIIAIISVRCSLYESSTLSDKLETFFLHLAKWYQMTKKNVIEEKPSLELTVIVFRLAQFFHCQYFHFTICTVFLDIFILV